MASVPGKSKRDSVYLCPARPDKEKQLGSEDRVVEKGAGRA